uniref:Cuticular protein 47 n=1 Tax=Leptinotarsa decemlineata TaxID=7539 RepID=A0A3S7SJM6_LEPDE|nr:cuticular protein 47 [Leptinotarsa decemlineata]
MLCTVGRKMNPVLDIDYLFQIFVLLVVAVASVYSQGGYGGGYGGGHFGGLGVGDHHHLEEYIDYSAPPKYHYDYAVHDSHHHDFKSQYEARDGKETKGRYELLQPDGRKRIVEYVAGKHGVDYKVRYEGKSEHGGIGALSGGGYGGY